METALTVAMAKRDFSYGFCKGYTIERAPFGGGWHVLIKMHGKTWPIVDARGKKPRAFKTLDAAVHVLEAVGFRIDSLSSV